MKIKQTATKEMTWEELKALAESGGATECIHPFDEIALTLEGGETATVVVGAILPPTEDKAGTIRFVFKDCLDEARNMNDEWSNAGGWPACGCRQYLQERLLPRLPAELRAVIKPRKITCIVDKGNTVECEDLLWLPSETDMFGRGDDSWQHGKADGQEDFQMAIFTTERDRVKQRKGYGTTPYWCRSVHASTSATFCLVSTNGSASGSGAYNSYGVAPGFDI